MSSAPKRNLNLTTIHEYRCVPFGSLNQGDLFYDLDDEHQYIHIKVNPFKGYTSVCLADGEPGKQTQDCRVVPVFSVIVEVASE
jgi:hypothetical protein